MEDPDSSTEQMKSPLSVNLPDPISVEDRQLLGRLVNSFHAHIEFLLFKSLLWITVSQRVYKLLCFTESWKWIRLYDCYYETKFMGEYSARVFVW